MRGFILVDFFALSFLSKTPHSLYYTLRHSTDLVGASARGAGSHRQHAV